MKIFGLFLSFTLFIIFPSVAEPDQESNYIRPPPRPSIFLSHHRSESDPQQVHISLAGKDYIRVTFITDDTTVPSIVEYGRLSKWYNKKVKGEFTSYRFYFYNSGKIHHVKIGPLRPNTVYYYRCGGRGDEYSFKTPPSTFPIEFAIAGDLGQTDWTRRTLDQMSKRDFDVFILPGDLSYADSHQPRWDSFGRLMEPLASTRPWMVIEGNHEIESYPVDDKRIRFKAYNARWRMPHDESLSHSNLYYSFDVAGVHTVMLTSYTRFSRSSDQYIWLQNDLRKVDRKTTPWLVAVMHAPWYNTNKAHEGEGEKMRRAMETLLYRAQVDVVFAGHVHAYERFTRIYKHRADPCGPLYVTIGDGGNHEGLASSFRRPRSHLSKFREASFGYGRLRIINEDKAHWTWHRNSDSHSVVADEVWLKSHRALSNCTSNQFRDEL